MIYRNARETGDFALAAMGAVVIAGLIYVGVLLLNQAEKPMENTSFEGAIRITQAKRDEPVEPLRRKELKETEPPERLPKTFSAQSKAKQIKPLMQLSVPDFTADMHPGLTGDIALPRMELGSIGFNMDEVDEVPQIVRSVPPQYPYSAKRHHIEGEVVVRMLVNSQGEPTNLSIHKSDPPGVFDKTALNAAKRWKFKPGRYKGRAVDTWVLLPFNFKLTQ